MAQDVVCVYTESVQRPFGQSPERCQPHCSHTWEGACLHTTSGQPHWFLPFLDKRQSMLTLLVAPSTHQRWGAFIGILELILGEVERLTFWLIVVAYV